MTRLLDFSQKVIAVTGGSRGIGAAVVKLLASQGAHVYFTWNSSESTANDLCQECANLEGRVVAVKCDVREQAEVKEFFSTIKKTEKKLDGLLTAAGTMMLAPLLFTREEAFLDQIKVHLLGTTYCFQQAFRIMSGKKYGRIVAISSLASLTGYGNRAAYASAKAAVNALVKTSAREFASFNVNVNAVLPGYTATDMTSGLDDSAREVACKSIPLGRFAAPEEIASTIAFLLSEQASYITGELVKVDGGLGM